MKYKISVLFILCFHWVLAQEPSTSLEKEDYVKEYVKSFSLRNSDTILISLPIPYEIIDWDRDIVRIFTQVESFSLPDNILRIVSRKGRYRMRSKRKNRVTQILLPDIKDKITVQGVVLSEEVVAKIYVPHGFPLKVACSTKNQAEQIEDLWLQQEVLTRRLDYPIKRAINADNYADVKFEEGEILAAEKVKGTTRFLKLKVKVGENQYDVVSRIGRSYSIEALIGKAVIFVAHNERAEVRKLKNEGMILMKETAKKKQVLVEKKDLPDFFFLN